MSNLFDMNNRFFQIMGKISDLIILNILCLVCCIPVITAGASITALYFVTMKMVNNEESYVIKSFFKSFRQNFRQATCIHLIFLIAATLIFFDFRITGQLQKGPLATLMFYAFFCVAFLFILIVLYAYPILAKFYNSTKNILLNSILMAIRHLPYTIFMIIITFCPLGLILFFPNIRVQATLMGIYLIAGAGLIAYFNSFFLVKIFDQYINKEPSNETQNQEISHSSSDASEDTGNLQQYH